LWTVPPNTPLPLHHSAVFQDYSKLIEKNLEKFLSSELSVSVDGFYSALNNCNGGKKNDVESGTNMATAITCVVKFESFANMMKAYVLDGVSPVICPPLYNEETDELEFE
jgi:hypothetical protein